MKIQERNRVKIIHGLGFWERLKMVVGGGELEAIEVGNRPFA